MSCLSGECTLLRGGVSGNRDAALLDVCAVLPLREGFTFLTRLNAVSLHGTIVYHNFVNIYHHAIIILTKLLWILLQLSHFYFESQKNKKTREPFPTSIAPISIANDSITKSFYIQILDRTG